MSPVDVTISGDGDGALGAVSVAGTSVGLGWSSDLPDPSVSAATASYAAGSDTHVQVTATSSGFSANVILASAPDSAPTYTFPLLAGGLTPSLDNGVLSFHDSSGAVVAATEPLRMWDAQFDRGGDPSNSVPVEAELVTTAAGTELQLTPSMAFLTDPSTVYPVTVDPTLSSIAQNDTDHYYINDGTSTAGNAASLWVGENAGATAESRAFLNFKIGRFVGRNVNTANLQLFQWEAGSCSNQTFKIYPVSATGLPGTTTPYIWANKPTADTETNWTQSPSFNTGGASCSTEPDGFENANVTKIVDAWANGEIPELGMIMQAPSGSETDTTYGKRFCSMDPNPNMAAVCNSASRSPQLTVTWNIELGSQPGYSMTSHKLNDRSTLMVNNENGNGVIEANDISVKGRGMDLGLSRFYNSSVTQTDGQFGVGWTMSGGPDVKLRGAASDPTAKFNYDAPSQTALGLFVRKSAANSNDFWNPTTGGIDADLTDSGGGTSSHHHYTLKFHQSQAIYEFDNFGVDANAAVLDKMTDRNGNAINFGYSSTGVWTSVTDTHGRSYTVHHNSSGYVDSITDPSGRVWAYGYTGDHLTSYTDPTGAVTTYGWTGDQVTTITDPAQSSGVHPTTTLTYSSAQLTGVQYAKTSSTSYQFTFSYTDVSNANNRTADARCNKDSDDDNKKADYSTSVVDVSDPQNGTTTYCFIDPSGVAADANAGQDRIVRTIDGLGKRRSETYNPDQKATTSTSAANDSASGESTVASYNTNNMLKDVTEPGEGSGDTGGTANIIYNTSSSVTGSQYLPSSTTNAQGNCTAYGYDSKGNLSDSYGGQAGSSSPSDCAKSGSEHTHTDHNADGTPSRSATPSGTIGSQPDQTTYYYFTVEPNKGELKSVVRPGGNATCTTNRTLCTSYTYDPNSRVATVTDGNYKTSTYTYDADDRVTQVLLNGTTTCSTSAGTCLTYAYDGEGNLTSRVGKTGTTGFTYDRLNRPATETLPNGTTVTTTYDGANDLTSYVQTVPGQSADTVTYTYDAANKLMQIVDATGTYHVVNTDDGYRSSISYPTSPAVTISYGYTKANKVKSITSSGATGIHDFTYSYKSGSHETDKVQSMSTNGITTTYSYGHNDRLTGANASSGTDYTYGDDHDGNLVTATAGSTTTYYGYNEADELCWSGVTDGTEMAQSCPSTPSGDTSYASDAAGNNTGASSASLVYNFANQATSLTPQGGGSAVAATYTDQGNDLRATVGSTTLVNGVLGVTARTTAAGTKYYTRDPQGHVLSQHGTGGTAFYYSDYQYSTIALLYTNGAAVTTFGYAPYGATTTTSGGSTTTPFRWTGAYQDIEGDNYYHLGARYYDQAAHFTQPDSVQGSVADPKTLNIYTYAGGDPINNTDPTGHFSLGSFLGGVGSAITAVGLGLTAVATAPACTTIVGCGPTVASIGGAIGAAGASYEFFKNAF